MIFLKPNIAKLKKKCDIQGLIKVLLKPKCKDLHKEAAFALAELGSESGLDSIKLCFNNKTLSIDDYKVSLEKAILNEKQKNTTSEKAISYLLQINNSDVFLLMAKARKEKYIADSFYFQTLLSINTDNSFRELHNSFINTIREERKELAKVIKTPELSALPDLEQWDVLLDSKSDASVFKRNTYPLEVSLQSKDEILKITAADFIKEIANESYTYLSQPLIKAFRNEKDSESIKGFIINALGKIKDPNIFEQLVKFYPEQSGITKSEIIRALEAIDHLKTAEHCQKWIKKEKTCDARSQLVWSIGKNAEVNRVRELIPLLKIWEKEFNTNSGDYRKNFKEPFQQLVLLLSRYPEKDILQAILNVKEYPEELREAKEYAFSRDTLSDKVLYIKKNDLAKDVSSILVEYIHSPYLRNYLTELLKLSTDIFNECVESIIKLFTKTFSDDYSYLRYENAFKFIESIKDPVVAEIMMKYFDNLVCYKYKFVEYTKYAPTENTNIIAWRAIINQNPDELKLLGNNAILSIKEALLDIELSGDKNIELRMKAFEILAYEHEDEAFEFLNTLSLKKHHDAKTFWILLLNKTKSKLHLTEHKTKVDKWNSDTVLTPIMQAKIKNIFISQLSF